MIGVYRRPGPIVQGGLLAPAVALQPHLENAHGHMWLSFIFDPKALTMDIKIGVGQVAGHWLLPISFSSFTAGQKVLIQIVDGHSHAVDFLGLGCAAAPVCARG